jgi:hypothetical protein
LKNSFFIFKYLLCFALFHQADLNAQDTVRVTPYGAEGAKIGNLMHDIRLGTHYLKTDKNYNILPWYSADLGESYDFVLNNVWKFWDEIPYAFDGTKYYMIHRIRPSVIKNVPYYAPGEQHDDGIGGDQIQMILDSWTKWYAYSGNPKVLENMVYMTEFYLARGLSIDTDEWTLLPYPWHTSQKADFRYDGDLRDGKGVTQIDKAGDFGYQLIILYKMTGNERYLQAAIQIANVLSAKMKTGDAENSPLPYKVRTKTGEVLWSYTSNWAWTMKMFDELVLLKKGQVDKYKKASMTLQDWVKKFPIPMVKYGPFFEDISIWSNTGINAGRLAEYILLNTDKWGTTWQADSRKALDFLCVNLANPKWKKYGVTTINEQTAYMYPGNSHTSRAAYLELLYAQKTGNASKVEASIRQLNWATYSVDYEGRNVYPGFSIEIWFTDGYGDYVSHYLNSMALLPERLSASDKNHLLGTSSIIQEIKYETNKLSFKTFDNESEVVLRLVSKPKSVTVSGQTLNELNQLDGDGYVWKALEKGGVLKLKYSNGANVVILQE